MMSIVNFISLNRPVGRTRDLILWVGILSCRLQLLVYVQRSRLPFLSISSCSRLVRLCLACRPPRPLLQNVRFPLRQQRRLPLVDAIQPVPKAPADGRKDGESEPRLPRHEWAHLDAQLPGAGRKAWDALARHPGVVRRAQSQSWQLARPGAHQPTEARPEEDSADHGVGSWDDAGNRSVGRFAVERRRQVGAALNSSPESC